MSKILALWATPRSTSTAFERVMSNRGDMTCFHEPYSEAYYYGEDRRNERYFTADPSLEATCGLTFSGLHNKLTTAVTDGQVFIKDFASSIIHMADDAFLDSFTHTFLIRDPEKVLTSMHARWPDVSLPEIGFEELHTLCRRIADREGKAPVVIDSDELLATPEASMKAYCAAVGVPYIADAMSWEKRGDNPTWNSDEHGFHDSLKASTGLKPQKRDYPSLDSSADMMRLYKASKPHYDALYKMRIGVANELIHRIS